MGDPKYTCPLCCNKTFSSKQLLQAHLSDILQNLYCPICKNKWASLVHLIEHLNLDNCQPEDTEHTIIFDTGTQGGRNENTSEISNVTEIDGPGSDQFSSNTLDAPANNEMYVEFLSKQFSKPCLQTQSLKLVRDPDEQRESYFVVTQDNAELNAGHTIVTKQNKDGTISLTAVKDMKIETDTLISQSENDVEDSQTEIYSCNTCGVSFSSVLDHIQNYHNDQEVVVEEPIEESENDAMPLEYDNVDQDPLTPSDKQTPRRVITDTGDIVEAPLVVKSISELQSQEIVPTNLKSEEVTDNEGRVYTRRYVQIEKLCDSVIKDIKENDDKDGGPYHKVVLKEVQTTNGTNVKMYHCMSCNIYVSSLNEFKAHPCKTLKYKCPHCPVAYENSKSLCAHMKVHKLKAEGNTKVAVRYKCEVCCTVFPSNKSLKLHKRMHDPIKARPIEPPLFNRFGQEPSEGRYCCPTCDKMIPIDYKTIHQNSHKSSEKMNCQICNKKFSSEEYLEMHMTVHNIDKVTVNKQDKSLPYNCLYCSRRFARPHEKVKHERIHTGEKPHSCEICGKSFRVSYCLTLHMRTHTGARPYACPHCGKRFKAHSVFNHHLLTHSEVRAYKCPYCPKAFKTSVQLAGHKNSHTKPFSCQHCNRPFASLYAVRVHTETHARQNNLKFSCSLCGASYARAFALKDHVKQIHKQDIESNDNLGGVKEEDWIIRENADNVRSLKTAPSLPTEINVLGMTSNELIVP